MVKESEKTYPYVVMGKFRDKDGVARRRGDIVFLTVRHAQMLVNVVRRPIDESALVASNTAKLTQPRRRKSAKAATPEDVATEEKSDNTIVLDIEE